MLFVHSVKFFVVFSFFFLSVSLSFWSSKKTYSHAAEATQTEWKTERKKEKARTLSKYRGMAYTQLTATNKSLSSAIVHS